MTKNRAKTDTNNNNSDNVGINSIGKRKSSEDHDSEDEKRTKSKKADKSSDFDHGSKIERPTGYVVPSSLPIEESEDSDSDGASDDGSLSEAFAYASNAGLVQMQPHPVLVPVQPSVASVGDTQQAYLHTDPNNANSRHRWTPEMDNLLREGWSIYGKQWKKIAAHVGHGKDRSQCQHRWAVYLDPQLTLRKSGPWSEEETELLRMLVEKHRNVKNGSETSTNWVAVAKETGRPYKECRNRWKVLSAPTGKKGPFTEAEDQLIIKGVRDWPPKKQGIWTALQKVLNRRAKSICRRWTQMLSHENCNDPAYLELMKNSSQQLLPPDSKLKGLPESNGGGGSSSSDVVGTTQQMQHQLLPPQQPQQQP